MKTDQIKCGMHIEMLNKDFGYLFWSIAAYLKNTKLQ